MFRIFKCPVLYQGDDNDDKDDDIEEEEHGNGDVEVEHVGEIVPVDRTGSWEKVVYCQPEAAGSPPHLPSGAKVGWGT